MSPHRYVLLITLCCLSLFARATDNSLLQGRLEIVWGDAPPASTTPAPPRQITLFTDAGQRVALDPQRAHAAAGNLYRLQGRHVSVLAPESSRSSTAGALLSIESIVATDPVVDAQPSPDAVTGTQAWVSILCKFSDNTSEPKNLAYFSNMLSNQVGRLDDYWRTVSYGKVNVAGSTAFGWFVLPHPRSFYINTDGSANLGQLFTDCTGAANPTVDFSPYVGINQMFNDDLDCCAWGGNRYAALDTTSSRNWRVTWEPPWGYQNEAPLAHEMGHGFGLPHANNSDLDSDPYDNPWDVMSDAWDNAVSDATYGAQPKHINIYHRDQLGWVDAARKLKISAGGSYPALQLDRASLAGSTKLQMIQITLPNSVATHYYVLEARMPIAGSYEAALAGAAVIIHEVDQTRSEPSWSVDASVPPANVSNNEGSMFKVGESWTAPNGAFTVTVDSATANGFVVSIDRAIDEIIFSYKFEGSPLY